MPRETTAVQTIGVLVDEIEDSLLFLLLSAVSWLIGINEAAGVIRRRNFLQVFAAGTPEPRVQLLGWHRYSLTVQHTARNQGEEVLEKMKKGGP